MEAAKIFLETSPHLQECRTVISKGKRFSTKVSGMALIDIIEKFFAINSTGKILIQVENLQTKISFYSIYFIVDNYFKKIANYEQSKHCGDLLKELKFLIEQTQGEHFIVNINVPLQVYKKSKNLLVIIINITIYYVLIVTY